jgi:hypothetical protein
MMLFFWMGIAVVVVLLGVAGWTDLKARRAGRPIRGVDRQTALDTRRAAQAEYNQRTHQQYGGGGGVF